MQTAGRIILLTITILISILGLGRLNMEADLTGIFPEKVAQIQAVRSFNKHFHDDRIIVVWVQSSDDKVYLDDVADLASVIEEELPSEVKYDVDSGGDHQSYVQDLAEVWALSEPEVVNSQLSAIHDHDQLRTNLQNLKDQIRRNIQSKEAIKSSYDPLGFLKHPGISSLSSGSYSFQSIDKKSRFLFIKLAKKADEQSYLNDAEVVTELRSLLNDWNEEYDGIFSFGLTGGPVYNAEVGTGMQKDLIGTMAISLSVICLMFLILQRSFLQLLGLVILVAATFLLTLGIAGWILPSLNVLSVGFAAILLGLIIDYAIVILRESGPSPKERGAIRRRIGPSIIWAALTTSLVFSILTLSSFPGVRQLGILILIGLACGAYVMLYGVPWVLELLPVKAVAPPPHRHRQKTGLWVLIAPLILIAVGSATFFLKGTPTFDFSLHKLQPTFGEASQVQNALTEKFASWSDLRTTVFATAESPEELATKLHRAQKSSERLIKNGLISEMQLPAGLIPRPTAYADNLVALRSLAERIPEIEAIVAEEGFTEEAIKYNKAIVAQFQALPDTYEEFLDRGRRNGITRRMIALDGDTILFRGNVTLTEPLTAVALAQMTELNSQGVLMTGWSTLATALEPLVERDFRTIFLPAVIVILIALIVVFRNWRESLLVLLILVSSLIIMNAFMVLTGTSWNFLNIIAFPLIIGIGIDYSIHLIFALRRHQSSSLSISRGVGLAITFCGLSSFVGFGSLSFAQNEVLRSLGIICSLGALVTMSLTLIIIPPVWRATCHRKDKA